MKETMNTVEGHLECVCSGGKQMSSQVQKYLFNLKDIVLSIRSVEDSDWGSSVRGPRDIK